MASTADNWGLYPTGCGSCSNSDRYESRLRLARLDVDKEKLDWYYEQEKWFGQSTAIAYGDWGTNDIFLGGAFDNKKTKNSEKDMEWVPCVFHMQNSGKKYKLWKLKINGNYQTSKTDHAVIDHLNVDKSASTDVDYIFGTTRTREN